MIVEEHLYATMQCPMMEKTCAGPQCMAWRQEMRMVEKPDFANHLNPKYEPTGKGFCGMVYKSPR